ncbi:hypothetical protein FNT36_14375 [Hymenobacter setariae]|uniref:Uncharacterized protein n=1 Tax=Hymenobacter setariae TaxID=2594794 RepID=A0A558BVZ1_9BACT|nr:hypothetical protein [Hymenobacter setariae]TVT40651.1 hypothetical protein FNT36_14375 [Hymenobacter setariae]
MTLATPQPPLPSLTINDQGRVYLHPTLVEQLHLASGQPANLVPPPKGSDYWHLDLRPEAERFITPGNGRNLRIHNVRLPFSLLNPDEPPLMLYLLPGEPAQLGYYPLLPAPAFAQAYTAFLEQAAQAAWQAEQGTTPA